MKKSFFLALFSIIFLFSFFFFLKAAVAADADSFDTAKDLVFDNTIEITLNEGQKFYWKFNADSGTKIKISEFYAQGWSRFSATTLTLYNKDRRSIKEFFNSSSSTVEPGVLDTSDFYYVLSSEYAGNPVFYLVLASNKDNTHFRLKVSKENFGDAGNTFDIYDELEKAYEITPGEISGTLIAGAHGSDEIDYYKMKVKELYKYSLQLTPSEEALIWINIFNEDRGLEDGIGSDQAGEIVSGSYISPKDQTIYLKVERRKGGKYTLEITEEEKAECFPGNEKCENNVIYTCDKKAIKWEKSLDCPAGCEEVAYKFPKKGVKDFQCKKEAAGLTTKKEGKKAVTTDEEEKKVALTFLGLSMLPLIIVAVLVLLQIIFQIVAWVHIFKSGNESSWKLTWFLVTLIFGLLGVIIYFIVGRKSRIPREKGSESSQSTPPKIETMPENQSSSSSGS